MRYSAHGRGSVLLGRPWLFDRDVAQYGRTNWCIFYFGGSKHVWQPFIPQPADGVTKATAPTPPAAPRQFLGIVTARQFLKGVESDAPVWAIQVRTKLPDTELSEFPSFLREFANVFPSKSPASLPPNRTVQHFIDFVPGATLLNVPH